MAHPSGTPSTSPSRITLELPEALFPLQVISGATEPLVRGSLPEGFALRKQHRVRDIFWLLVAAALDTVELDAETVTRLKTWKAHQATERLAANAWDTSEGDLVLTLPNGAGYDPDRFSRELWARGITLATYQMTKRKQRRMIWLRRFHKEPLGLGVLVDDISRCCPASPKCGLFRGPLQRGAPTLSEPPSVVFPRSCEWSNQVST